MIKENCTQGMVFGLLTEMPILINRYDVVTLLAILSPIY